MPSPFPGMDPYLEQPDVWHDFHESFCPACRALLMPQLGRNYDCRIDETVYIRELPFQERRAVGQPDVFVRSGSGSALAAGFAVVSPAPVRGQVLPAVDVLSLSLLRIEDRASRSVVTVIELLSPSNKQPGGDRNRYLEKRRDYLSGDVNLIEIDLLRSGPRMPIVGVPACDYLVIVSRAQQRPDVDLWPLSLHEPLPMLPIPLRAGDADLRLDLRAVLDAVYDAADYGRSIYDGTPDPPLTPDSAVWAAERLRLAGRTE